MIRVMDLKGSTGFFHGCGMGESRVEDDLRVSQVWGLKDCCIEDPIC